MKTYFISGVCGVGKSTLIPHLRNILSQDAYEVRDFDERGVPDGADSNWRKSEAKYWLSEGRRLLESKKELIVCGFVKSTDFEDLEKVEIIVLDADPEIIRKRLVVRYTKDGVFDENQRVIGKPVNEFIEGNVWYAKKMKEECESLGFKIIDTSSLLPLEVAKKVTEFIQN